MKLKFILVWISVLCGIMLHAQKFAILSDIHVTPGNANETKLKAAVEEINSSDVDYVLITGDLTNEGSDEQLRNVKSIFDRITKPQYVIPGNHENTWSQSACKTYNDLWGADRFVFTTGKLVVIGMNCGPFMKMGDGHIKQEDLIWLDKTLSETVKPGMKVLSVNHYPILDDLDNYRDYVAILKKYHIVGINHGRCLAIVVDVGELPKHFALGNVPCLEGFVASLIEHPFFHHAICHIRSVGLMHKSFFSGFLIEPHQAAVGSGQYHIFSTHGRPRKEHRIGFICPFLF